MQARIRPWVTLKIHDGVPRQPREVGRLLLGHAGGFAALSQRRTNMPNYLRTQRLVSSHSSVLAPADTPITVHKLLGIPELAWGMLARMPTSVSATPHMFDHMFEEERCGMVPAMKASTRSTVTLDDFMTGLLASLAEQHVTRVSIRGQQFYEAMVKAYEEFEADVEAAGLETDFFLVMNKVHGDSADVREGITKAVQRDLISLDNPVYMDMRLKVSEEDADGYLVRLPGDKSLYRRAASTFLAEYRG